MPTHPPERLPRTVLVVEDHQPIRELMVRILSEEGYHVLQAQDGHEALELVSSGATVQLVVTDLAMPRVNGVQLANRLVEITSRAIPVLFVSGYAYNPAQVPGRVVVKPFMAGTLVAEVAELLRDADRSAAVNRHVPPIPPETDSAIIAWMRSHGWDVSSARWEMDPDTGFHVWQEPAPSRGSSHALWVEEPMIRHLKADELVAVLIRERVQDDIKINFKIRIEERGAEYRVSVVPRRSGEFRKAD